jgi:hypothetical protein
MYKLVFVLLLLPVMGWGQTVLPETEKSNPDSSLCHINVDEFTQKKTIMSKDKTIGESNDVGLNYLEVSLAKMNGYFFMTLVPEFYSIQTIRKGDIVYIKFHDDSVMQLTVYRTSISDHKKGLSGTSRSGQTVWYNTLSFGITADQLQVLTDKSIRKVRCSLYTYEVYEKNMSTVGDIIRCIKSKE